MLELVKETVKAFHQQYNYGKSGAHDLMRYCRPSVEKYVFSKLYDVLFSLYAHKSDNEDRELQKKISLLQRNYRGRKLMRLLEVLLPLNYFS